ncbi:putative redox protein [Aminivibrio pyruvatiphilus]|uniref:Putative redox protein n=2 Tax=Aminivibrio pyruvatiphilus TaxID=1005740 RepID=A0A4R8MC11_9BACT|nr:putative redox protein [Aminivibrio pyruvatiphilus]
MRGQQTPRSNPGKKRGDTMSELHEEVTIKLVNDKVRFTGVSLASPDHPVSIDYVPPLGDGMGFRGLELFLLSFGGCSATAVVALLRKMGKTVSGFEVRAKGTRSEKPPIKLEKICIEFLLESKDAEEKDLRRAVQLAEESVCPVWQLIKNNVDVVPEYRVIK